LKTKLILVALFLVIAIVITAPLQATEAQPRLVIEIQRTAKVGQYGVVHVDDQFTILNNGTEPVSSLDFGFSRPYRSDFYYVEAKDSQGKQLSIDIDVNKTSEFYWMRAYFAHELGFNKTYNFTVTSVLDGVIGTLATGFEYNFTAAPVLTQDAEFANVTFISVSASDFKLPDNTTYITTNVGGLPALNREYKPWKAYSRETFYAPYATVNQFLLDLRWAERDIEISNDGIISVKDSYRFFNPSVQVSSFSLSLPEGASNVMAYDVVGAMWAAPQNPTAPYQVTISPRYSGGIRSNEAFAFTLTYDVPQSKYLKQLNWWGSYNLTFPMLSNKDDFLYDNASVRFIAPSGATVSDVKIPPQSPAAYPIQIEEKEHTFELRGITDLNNLTVGVAFTYVPFSSAFGTLPWIVGLEVAVVALAVVLRLRRGPELEVPIPVERLREFVGLYDERLALSRELVLMEEDVTRGSLTRHEFRRRKKVMELRLDELNKSLMEVKAELRALTARYDDMIRRIDRAEAEVEASRASMNQVRGQYRAGKTTRETYDTMVSDITKRIDRAEETIETILITLREEAR